MGKTTDYFKDWITTKVTYDKKSSMDGVGNITYASDTVDCYIQGMQIRVVNDKGEDITSSQQLYLNGNGKTTKNKWFVTSINFGDRFKLDNVYRPVKSIDKFRDEDGVIDLVVVYL